MYVRYKPAYKKEENQNSGPSILNQTFIKSIILSSQYQY